MTLPPSVAWPSLRFAGVIAQRDKVLATNALRNSRMRIPCFPVSNSVAPYRTCVELGRNPSCPRIRPGHRPFRVGLHPPASGRLGKCLNSRLCPALRLSTAGTRGISTGPEPTRA